MDPDPDPRHPGTDPGYGSWKMIRIQIRNTAAAAPIEGQMVLNVPSTPLDRRSSQHTLTLIKPMCNSFEEITVLFTEFLAVLRIRIRMDPHDFGLLDPHPESAFGMRIPDADADPG